MDGPAIVIDLLEAPHLTDDNCAAVLNAAYDKSKREIEEIAASLHPRHHVLPFAAGGSSTADNVELRCKAHNRHEATLFFGPEIARELRDTWG